MNITTRVYGACLVPLSLFLAIRHRARRKTLVAEKIIISVFLLGLTSPCQATITQVKDGFRVSGHPSDTLIAPLRIEGKAITYLALIFRGERPEQNIYIYQASTSSIFLFFVNSSYYPPPQQEGHMSLLQSLTNIITVFSGSSGAAAGVASSGQHTPSVPGDFRQLKGYRLVNNWSTTMLDNLTWLDNGQITITTTHGNHNGVYDIIDSWGDFRQE